MKAHIFLLTATVLTACSTQEQPKHYAFQDTSLPDSTRISLLISEMTIDEKLAMLHNTTLGVPRLGVPECGNYEGLHGVSLGGPAAWNGKIEDAEGNLTPNNQPSTIFPQSYGLGETWDPDLIRRIGDQMATEARWYFHSPRSRNPRLVVYAPNADLGRDPRWGRTEECFGEDAHLTATLTVAMVRGLQGDDPRYWKTAALMKHFLANSNEDARDSSSSDFSERLFREYYSYPFRCGIKEGGSRAIMSSYNAWNGVPMGIHPCLKAVVRDEWGNDGIICSDGGALDLLISGHHAYPTLAEGAAAMVKAGVSELLGRGVGDAIREAYDKGLISEAEIDNAIRGNLLVALKLGLLDGDLSQNPYYAIGRDTTSTPPYKTAEARALAREAQASSVVLLKNDGLLPIDTTTIRHIGLVGPYADNVVSDWYTGTPDRAVTILQGLQDALGSQPVEIRYEPDNACGRAEALARWADVVIVCTGNHPYGTRPEWKFCPLPSDGREGVDRKSLQLPDEDLVRQLHAINPHTVLVLVSSFPYTINWSAAHLPAIVHTTHSCEEQGTGLADVLLGHVNPAGRLTQTWPADILDLPTMMDYDISHGRTYMYATQKPLFPFGYGLSYTTFAYESAQRVGKDSICVTLKNTGDRDGDEVIQVYATFPKSPVAMPRKRLCAFKKVFLKAGEQKSFTLPINTDVVGYWDESRSEFEDLSDSAVFEIGASSEDIRLRVK